MTGPAFGLPLSAALMGLLIVAAVLQE